MKVTVRLVNSQNSFKDDDGKRFPANEDVKVELTDRIKNAIQCGLLEKVRGADVPEKEEELADTKPVKPSEKPKPEAEKK